MASRGGVNRVRKPTDNDIAEAKEVLAFLNEKTGRVFKPTEVNLHFIMARRREGYTMDECRQVIAMKVREWRGTEQAKYLRPATLFNQEKFNQYAGFLGAGGE